MTDGERLRELRAVCPGADDGFLLAQLEAGASPAEASAAWLRVLSALKTRTSAELAEKNRELERVRARRSTGLSPVESHSAGERASAGWGDPVEAWREKVAEKVARGMSRMAAVQAVVRENPGLREAMLEQHNLQHGRRLGVVG